MLIFGNRAQNVLMEQIPSQYCPVCERDRPFSVWLQYQYEHVYFIFGHLRSRKYYLLCDVCGRGEKLDRREYEQKLEKLPIPFMHRFGCWIFLVLMAALVWLTAGRK